MNIIEKFIKVLERYMDNLSIKKKFIQLYIFCVLFYGVFLIDVGYSLNILNNIQKFAKENDIIVQYEAFRKHIGELRNEFKEKERFVFSMKLDHISIKKSLKAYFDKYYK